MRYNKLGDSGLLVSELSFGAWVTFQVRCAPTAGSTGGRARTARGQKVSVSGLGRAVRTGRVPMRTRRGYLPHDGQC